MRLTILLLLVLGCSSADESILDEIISTRDRYIKINYELKKQIRSNEKIIKQLENWYEKVKHP